MFNQRKSVKKKRGFISRFKREVGKDIALFTAGAITATVAIINGRQQKRLKNRYKNQVRRMKKASNK